MKCIHCGTDSKLKERAGGRCKRCGRPFAFEPTKQQGLVITDRGFQAAIAAATEQAPLAVIAGVLLFCACGPVLKVLPIWGAALAGGAVVALALLVRALVAPAARR